MRLLLTIGLGAAVVLPCVGGTIDFTPTEGKRELEGIVFPQIVFHQDGHAISYEPPRGWNYSGTGSQFTLTPPKLSQAQASIGQVRLSAPQGFDAATIKNLQQAVIASLPADAVNVQIVAEESNPLRINQQDTYEVTLSYRYFGQDYLVSVIFADLGDLQLRFRIAARKADFDALHRAFRGSLVSFHWS